jgi:hypothetical protein
MPIIKDAVAPNGITVGYHTPSTIEINLKTQTARLRVQSHTDEAAAISQKPIAWNWDLTIDLSAIHGVDSIPNAVENALIAPGSPFEGGVLTIDRTASLEVLKLRKSNEITADRLKADADHFMYSYTDSEGNIVSKDIRTGNKDMVDLLTTNSYVTLFGEFDEDWPGGWKAIDNTYVQIATIDQWKDFFKCMYKTGIANFKKSQLLKAQIEAATTLEEVAAINWNTV